MDELSQSFKAYKVLLELCSDRNYIVPDEYNEIDFPTFRYLYNNKQYDIFCEKHKTIPNKKIYIKFIQGIKIKPNTIREYVTNITAEFLDNNDVENELIVVLKNKPNNSILKIEKEKEFRHCEILWLAKVQFNITKHCLVPKHIPLTESETEELLSKYNITNIYQLPYFSKDDAIVRYYNFKPGTVCKILRPSKTAVEHTFYRCVK